jgi:serine/threonine protein kinase
VVGAWRWLPEYGFGIVVEQDYAEAFQMPNRLRSFVWGLFAVVVLAGAALLLTTMLVSRLSRKMSQTVNEARRLGQYSLEDKIGEGGMGAVYRATHAMLRRPTAVKLLHPERAGAEETARFEREVQVTSRLTHPNTIAIYDYGRDAEGVFYYAMEYLPGIDLKKLVEVDGAQWPGRVIHILRQICGSLSEAHGIGLIHRDIKPGNIILCERGGVQDVAKVLDFGIVKSLTPGDTQLTAAGFVTGTPMYMSPEALTRPEKIDQRADLYAVGAVGFYLLTGTPVFQGDNMMDVATKHMKDTPDRPSERLGREIPPDLEELILLCLSKSPMERPATARDLADRLSACQAAGTWTRQQALDWWRAHSDLVDTEEFHRHVVHDDGAATLVVDVEKRLDHDEESAGSTDSPG